MSIINIFGGEAPEPTSGDRKFAKQLRWHINSGKQESLTAVEITPAMAANMLEFNDRNRPVSTARVQNYLRQMLAGEWRYTRVPIIFSNGGRLIDGQHRLRACLESGKSFTADIAFGAPDDSFYFIDVGGTRTAADIFAINGVSNHTMAAAATRFLMAYDAGKMSGEHALGGERPNLQRVYEAYLGYSDLQQSLAAGRWFAENQMPRPSVAAAVHYICAQKSRKAADEYFEKVATGVGFASKKEPAYKVRQFLIRDDGRRLVGRDVAAALIAGWNALRTNKPLGTINAERIGRAA